MPLKRKRALALPPKALRSPIGAVSLHRLPKSTALLRAKQKYARTLCAVVGEAYRRRARDFGKYGMEPCEERVCETGAAGKNALIELFEKSALGE